MRHLVATQRCSQRQACRFIGLSRSTARYKARPRTGEASLVERLKEFAKKRYRRGYRLAHQELRRAGGIFAQVNHKRVHRLWRREGLSVPPRRKRSRRVQHVSMPREVVAEHPNSVWCFDFVQDNTIHGAKLRILSVTDEFTRESLALEVGPSFKSERVCQIIERLITERGTPTALRMDNGPEFVALALRGLCHRHKMTAAYIEPGKPWQNGFAESFHARLRDEFLEGEVFLCLRDAQVRLGSWRRYWNSERLHSSLDYQTPVEFAERWKTGNQQRKSGGGAKDKSGA